MKYKGFIIEAVYNGDTFRERKNGTWVERKPTYKDIEYYDVIDPMTPGSIRCMVFYTLQEAKTEILKLLAKMNMPDNSPKSWDKL